MGGYHHAGALLQRSFDSRQGSADTRVGSHFTVFYRHVQIGADQYAFTRQIQIGHLNYRHGEPSLLNLYKIA